MSTDLTRTFLEAVAGYTDTPAGGERSSADIPVKLGTVDALYAGVGNPRVLFDGETVMGVRTYAYVGRKPVALERVALIPVGHTYLIVGIVGDTVVAGLQARALSGLVPIVPTSVTVTGAGATATVNADGSVDYAGASSLQVNGIFSAAFRHYKMTLAGSSADYLSLQLSNGGTPVTLANYQWQSHLAQIGVVYSGSGFYGQNVPLIRLGAGPGEHELTIFSPFESTVPTGLVGLTGWGATSPTVGALRGSYNGNTSFSGAKIAPMSGTMTGRVRFYGLA